jgi:hypothetical protein
LANTPDPQQLELAKEMAREGLGAAKRQTIGCGMGCLGSIIGTLIAAVILIVLFAPWAFYIGGHPTPTTTWEGYGKLHSSIGADYGLYLKLSYYHVRRSRQNLSGGAALCTPQGKTLQYGIDGRIDGVWLYTEGKQTKLTLEKVKADTVNATFDLYGEWQNGRLVLNDRGSMGKPFHADGSVDPKGRYNPMPIKNEQANATISYGTKFDFDEFCANEIVKR